MTDDPRTWAVAVVQVVTAAVFALYWVTWFRQPHDEPWLPDGYVDHERVFVYSDGVAASLLVLSAVLAVFENAWGRTLALVCSGMLLFLGVIDAAYFGQHRMFSRARGGLVNGGVVAGVLAVAVILVVAYH